MLHSKKWICDFPDKEVVNYLAQELNISKMLAMVLVNRGIKNPEEGKRFLWPEMDDLFDPYRLPDMEVAVNRIMKAIQIGEKICVYGDYDVDGITSVSIMAKTLNTMGADVFYYIPNRMDEGYGLNQQALEEIRGMGARLVITVDCGITSIDEVAFGNSIGLDIIVTDHHQCQESIPPALGVINPRRTDCDYPYKELAGVGVAYKLCKALENKIKGMNCVDGLLDIVALGTVADIVPLTGENRVLVSQGLKILQNTANQGLKALIEVSGLRNKEINTGHIAFVLAPRINAAGRLSDAQKGVELFLTGDPKTAYLLARELDTDNRERQNIENAILEQAVEIAERKKDDSILVIASSGWHPGVIGIVASKVVEKFNKPAVLFCIDGNEARGSGRSITGLDLYDLLSTCKHYYNKFGGHKQAAGLSINVDKLEEFAREINEVAFQHTKDIEKRPIINVEGDLTGQGIGLDEADQLSLVEPCGYGNPVPIFVKRGVRVVKCRRVGNGNEHLKLVVEENNRKIDGIVFGWGEQDCPVPGEAVDLVFTPQVNRWMGRDSVQLVVKDIKRIDGSFVFLSHCNKGINKLMENESNNRVGQERLTGLEIIRVEDKVDFLINIFRASRGNILLTNSYRAAAEIISVLSLIPDAELHFSSIKEYDKNKNFVVIYPVSFKEFEKMDGNLYIYGWCIFPGQLANVKKLNKKVDKHLIIGDGESSMDNELRSLFPDSNVLKQVYFYISNKKDVELERLLDAFRGKEIGPIAVLRAVDALKYSKLIEVSDNRLVILPPPEAKVDINSSRPYTVIKDFVSMARECFSTVKNYPFDI